MKDNYSTLYHAIARLDLDSTEKLLMFVMCTFATARGENIYAGESILAERMKKSVRQVRRIRANLLKSGYLEKTGQKNGYADVYRLVIPGVTRVLSSPETLQAAPVAELNQEFTEFFEEAPAPSESQGAWSEADTLQFLIDLKKDQQTGLVKHLFIRYGMQAGFTEEDMLLVWSQAYSDYGLAPIPNEQPITI